MGLNTPFLFKNRATDQYAILKCDFLVARQKDFSRGNGSERSYFGGTTRELVKYAP